MVNIFHRSAAIALLTVLVAMIFQPTNATAVSTYELEKINAALNSDKLKLDEDVFDGNNFGPTIDQSTAQRHVNDYIRALNSSISTYNGLSNDAKLSDEGKKLLKMLQEGQLTSKKMRSALSRTPKEIAPTVAEEQKPAKTSPESSETSNTTEGTAEKTTPATEQTSGMSAYEKEQLEKAAASKAAKEKARAQFEAQRAAQEAKKQKQREKKEAQREHAKLCNQFKTAAMTAKNRNPMLNLMLQVAQGDISLTSAEQISETRNVAGKVQAICEATDMQALTARKCYYTTTTFEYDPAKWCEAAAQGEPLVKAMALNGAKRLVGSLGSSLIQSPEEFKQRNGFLTFEGPVTYESRLTFSPEKLSNQRGAVEKLLVASGEENTEKVWDEQKVRLETLRKLVDQTAGDWQLPSNKDSDYSGDLAAKQIKSFHEDAEIVDAWLSRESWKIHRNALGVILRRTRPGYILFKLEEDPHCQLKRYTQTEQYVGGGNYQKTDQVSFGYVRFQSCDN
ncbi:hypothetical protein [Sneathiella limimaris]|uniref:hypothetical protein n=1 Tax=Sneathiella limimaris TaxID=1964213 RepID=UPI00146CDF8C|nr:hypothetical protein [Sneathiella limimaris]